MAKELKTNAMRFLDKNKINYEITVYDCPEFIDGATVARKLGQPEEETFKTLVAQGKSGNYYCFLIPVLLELDMKKAAKSVGEKLKSISKMHQVLCVTHLASIAAKGEYNYFVSKKVENETTKTSIKQLNEEEVLREIARISSGTVTDISINHAKELRYPSTTKHLPSALAKGP